MNIPEPSERERLKKALHHAQEHLERVRRERDYALAEVKTLKEERARMRAVILELAAEFTAGEER